MPVHAVGERIGRIDTHAPLDLAGEPVDGIDRQIRFMPGGSHAHQRQVTAGGRTHDTDPVRVQAILRSLAPDHPDGPLQVLPGSRMLGKAFRTRGPVTHGHDRHPQVIEIAPGGRHLEASGVVAHVSAAGVDNLDGRSLELLREMPLDIGRAQRLLGIGHPAFRPDVFLDVLRATFIRRETVQQGHFRLDGAQETHLRHELDAPLEAEGAMSLVRIQVQFRRNAHLPELPVHQRGPHRGIRVDLTVVQAHRAGLLIELEHVTDRDIRAIALPKGWRTRLTVRGHIGRRVHDGPVDVAGGIVHLVDGRVRRRLRAGGEQEREV